MRLQQQPYRRICSGSYLFFQCIEERYSTVKLLLSFFVKEKQLLFLVKQYYQAYQSILEPLYSDEKKNGYTIMIFLLHYSTNIRVVIFSSCRYTINLCQNKSSFTFWKKIFNKVSDKLLGKLLSSTGGQAQDSLHQICVCSKKFMIKLRAKSKYFLKGIS